MRITNSNLSSLFNFLGIILISHMTQTKHERIKIENKQLTWPALKSVQDWNDVWPEFAPTEKTIKQKQKHIRMVKIIIIINKLTYNAFIKNGQNLWLNKYTWNLRSSRTLYSHRHFLNWSNFLWKTRNWTMKLHK